MGEENIMGARLPGKLLSLLIILKVFGSTEASCTISGSSADCRSQNLASVPQNLPTGITRLHLQNNQITTLSQSDFSRYRSLTRLDLPYNQIATINTRAFFNLPNLQQLYLYWNRLSNLSADMFTGLGNLQYLDLHSNDISDIQAGTFSSTPQLTRLSVSYYNKLTNLSADMFTGLGNLQELYLGNNEISEIQTGTFNSNPKLKTLSIGNKLTTLRSDMFTGLGNLQYLWLNINEISDIQSGTFSPTPQLINLYLSQNKLTNLRSDMFTGLGNLQTLELFNNEISDIQAKTFSPTPQLRELFLYHNKLTTLRPGMFTGLGNLQQLWLGNNEISDIQAGTFNSTPQLRTLRLYNNRLTVLKAEIFVKLSSIYTLSIGSNPWQCDCRMVPFRQKMNGSHSFENQITCEGPSNFHGQKLKDISTEDLICEEPTIVRFERVHNYTEVAEGESLHLVCEASGVPTPDITVNIPFGLNATVESSGGRVTMGVNGAITITNVTAADAGLYFCTAVSPVGSTSATLVVHVQLKVTTTTTGPVAPVIITSPLTTYKPESSSSYHESVFVGNVTSPVGSTSATPVENLKATTTETTGGTVTVAPVTSPLTLNSKPENSSSYHESVPAFSISVPVFIGSVCGSVAVTVLIGAIVFTIWHKRKKQKPSSDPPPPVVYSNALAMVTIGEHDQTGQGGAQSRSESFEMARSSEHVPGCAASEDLVYEDVVLPPRNINTSPNAAGHEYHEYHKPHDYQSLGPNRNRAANDELPPLPPPSNRNNGGPTGAHDTPHYYLSLKKKT